MGMEQLIYSWTICHHVSAYCNGGAFLCSRPSGSLGQTQIRWCIPSTDRCDGIQTPGCSDELRCSKLPSWIGNHKLWPLLYCLTEQFNCLCSMTFIIIFQQIAAVEHSYVAMDSVLDLPIVVMGLHHAQIAVMRLDVVSYIHDRPS